MAKKKLDEIQFLAVWLHTAAQEAGQLDVVRKLIKSAMNESVQMYGAPKEEDLDDPPEEIPSIISKFAAAWDEFDRKSREE